MVQAVSDVNPIFPLKRNSLRDRLNFVAGDRRISPMLQAVGWSTGIIGRAMNDPDYLPGGHLLQVFSRVENVCIDWLVDGYGPPFRIADFASDTAAADTIAALRDETSWQATVYFDHALRTAIILAQPATVTFKRHRIRYTCLEVITGVVGAASVAALDGLPRINRVEIDADSLAALASGHSAGTYALTQAPQPPFHVVRRHNAMPVREPSAPYGLTELESDLVDNYRTLPDHHRALAQQVIAALGHRDDGPPSEPSEQGTPASARLKRARPPGF